MARGGGESGGREVEGQGREGLGGREPYYAVGYYCNMMMIGYIYLWS